MVVISMGKVNVKLLQGIEEAEGQVAKDRETQEVHAGEGDRDKEMLGKSPDNLKQDLDVQQRHDAESFKEQRKPKGRSMAANEEGRDLKKSNKKQVFSFRAVINDINIWKTYATASGRTMEEVGTEAMNGYIRRHKLSQKEQAVFDALMVRNVDR